MARVGSTVPGGLSLERSELIVFLSNCAQVPIIIATSPRIIPLEIHSLLAKNGNDLFRCCDMIYWGDFYQEIEGKILSISGFVLETADLSLPHTPYQVEKDELDQINGIRTGIPSPIFLNHRLLDSPLCGVPTLTHFLGYLKSDPHLPYLQRELAAARYELATAAKQAIAPDWVALATQKVDEAEKLLA
ncbi:MAG: hypothetical protein WC890_01460 [Candidatus Margulisiibacteriota bacterium]